MKVIVSDAKRLEAVHVHASSLVVLTRGADDWQVDVARTAQVVRTRKGEMTPSGVVSPQRGDAA